MGRHRTGVLYEPVPGGRVYVKKGRKSGFSIFWQDASGKDHEYQRTTLSAAKDRAEQVAAMTATPLAMRPFLSLIEDHLITKRPEHWADNYQGQQLTLAKRFSSIYGVACGDLCAEHIEAVIYELRADGLAASTEQQVTGLWKRLMDHGRKWGFVADGQKVASRLDKRKGTKLRSAGASAGAKHTGDEVRVLHRDDLPPWDDLFAFAQMAAERRGVWWEELRVLWLCHVGQRWGEHVGQRGSDLWLAPESRLASGQVMVRGKVVESKYKQFIWETYTKNGTMRKTAYPKQLHELLERRYQELELPTDLLFPGPNGGYESRSSYRSEVFLPVGQALGWPMKGKRQDGRASSLVWHPHDWRHVCATSMLLSPSPDPEKWYEGRGMRAPEVALALGDTVETILRTYVGKSEAGIEGVRRAAGW
jgi:integrase